MELRQYLEILVRRKWVIILTTLVTVAVAGLGSRFQQPVYSASAMVRVAQAPSGVVEYGDYVYAERLIKTYGELVKSRPFLEQVIAGLDLPVTPELLSKRVKIAVLPDTELLRITIEDSDPARAMAIANTLANLLVVNSQTLFFGSARSAREILEEQLSVEDASLEQDRAALQTLVNTSPQDEERIAVLRTRLQLQEGIYANLLQQYETARLSEAARANSVSVSEAAAQPTEPSRPSSTLNTLLGFFVGLFGGVGLAFLIESLDPTLHSANQAETVVHIPLLGSIPEDARAAKTATQNDPAGLAIVARKGSSVVNEAYRILRTNVLAPQTARDFAGGPAAALKSLLVTSPEPGTGKSTVSANLAAMLTEGGRKVILVDADLRRPRLHAAFGVPNAPGLSDLLFDQRSPAVLAGQSAVSLLRDTNFPGLRVLTSGSLPPNPTELLGTERMAALLGELSQQADMIVLDSPPVLAVADAAILAPLVDGVLLVAARDQSTARRTQRALELLEKVGARPLGLVFNRAHRGAEDYYYHYARDAVAGRERGERVQLAFAVIGVLVALCIVSIGVFALFTGPNRLRSGVSPRAGEAETGSVSKPGSQQLVSEVSSPTGKEVSSPTPAPTAQPGQAGKGVTPAAPSPALGAESGSSSAPQAGSEVTGNPPDSSGNSRTAESEARTPAVTTIAETRAVGGGVIPTTANTARGTQTAQPAELPASSAAGTSGAGTPPPVQVEEPQAAGGSAPATAPVGPVAAATAPAQAAAAGQATPLRNSTFPAGTGTPGNLPGAAQPSVPNTSARAGSSIPLGVGHITSREGSLGGGTFLLEDPYWKQPGAIWLPDGWPVEILEENIPGRASAGSNRWDRVRLTIGGQVYVGFVPARSIEKER